MDAHETNSTLIGCFLSSHKAREILENASQRAITYGYICLADFSDLCGNNPSYAQTKVGWTTEAFKYAKIERFVNLYTIRMPEYDWHENDDDENNSDETDSEYQSEPINLIINSKDNVEYILKAFFDSSKAFEDRPIFITIM